MHYTSQHRQRPTNNDVLLQQRRHFARSTKRVVSKRERFDKYSFEEGGRVSSPKEDKNILVIGSSGVLGKTLVSHFGKSRQWNVVGADVMDAERSVGEKGLSDYVRLPGEGSMADLTGELYRGVSLRLGGGESKRDKLDAIICASGGWAGDVDLTEMMESHLSEANSSELEDVGVQEEYARESADVCERMMRMNYYPIVAGSQVGRRFMKRGGKCGPSHMQKDRCFVHAKSLSPNSPSIDLTPRIVRDYWGIRRTITDARNARLRFRKICGTPLPPKLGTYVSRGKRHRLCGHTAPDDRYPRQSCDVGRGEGRRE